MPANERSAADACLGGFTCGKGWAGSPGAGPSACAVLESVLMGQMKRKAARKGAARKTAKGAAGKAKRPAAALKKRPAARKTVALTVARGPVSPAAREIINSTSATLDRALRRLADR